MQSTPSREQLSIAIGALGSESIRSKLESGELTELGRTVAREELARREREGEPQFEGLSQAVVEPDGASFDEFLRRPFGWSWVGWLAVGGACSVVVMTFGATARNKADQSFLLGVILAQGFALAGVIRVATSILSSSSAMGVLGKVLAVGALCVVLFGLTLCSIMARHGWGGG